MISGVEITKLRVHEDERGWLAEILRSEHLVEQRAFGQLHITTAHPNRVKGNHYHTTKNEWFCVIKGTGLLVLEDQRTGERDEIVMGDGNLVTVRIPPGVAHGIRNVGNDMMFLLVYNEESFDPERPDTIAKTVILPGEP